MKYYFFPLAARDQRSLERDGIHFTQFTLGEDEGVLIDEEQLAVLLNVRGLSLQNEQTSDYEGVFTADLVNADGAGRPATRRGRRTHRGRAAATAQEVAQEQGLVGTWPGPDAAGAMEAIATLLLPAVLHAGMKRVAIEGPLGRSIPPFTDDAFHIILWSSPDGTPERTLPRTIWGRTVHSANKAFQPSGRGAVILDNGSWPVAELVGSNLYVHYDLGAEGTANELLAFRTLLTETALLIPLSETERRERSRRPRDEKYQQAMQRWLEILETQELKRRRQAEEVLAAARASVEEAQAGLTQAIQGLKKAEEARAIVERRVNQERGKLEKEFDDLVNAPGVTAIDITEDKLIVHTAMLECVDPRTSKRHQIGEFRIEMKLDGSGDAIRWYNKGGKLDTPLGKFNAPHVDTYGKGCLGNTANVFPELMGQREYSAAVVLAVKFIESVNVNDNWGSQIELWPEAR